MDSNKYLDDISEIKNMMSRSSRFISLSGLSGVLAGVYALIGAYLANDIIKNIESQTGIKRFLTAFNSVEKLLLIALLVIAAAVITGIVLTYYKSKKNGDKLWDVSSKRLLTNFLIPLFTGGIFCFAMLDNGVFEYIAPSTLIFYGMACLNASKYTVRDVRYLGITVIILGLISAYFTGYGLYFWTLGFGVCHIIYGTLMHFKYDRKKI